MYSKTTASALLVCLSVGGLFQGVVAEVGKPFWSDNGLSPLSDFYEHQDGLGYNYVGIVPPQECLVRTNARCSADQVEAQLVTYSDDCAEPWLLCRCNDANMDMQTLAYRFSTIPPGVRSYIGAAVAFHEDSPHALFQSGYIEFYGDTSHAVFMHEATHAVDFNVANSGQPVSGTDAWNQALNSDSCVTDYYGNTNPTEEFAQVGVVARYQLARGGLPKDASCLANQLNFFQTGDNGRLWDALTRPKCHPPNRPFQLSNP